METTGMILTGIYAASVIGCLGMDKLCEQHYRIYMQKHGYEYTDLAELNATAFEKARSAAFVLTPGLNIMLLGMMIFSNPDESAHELIQDNIKKGYVRKIQPPKQDPVADSRHSEML